MGALASFATVLGAGASLYGTVRHAQAQSAMSRAQAEIAKSQEEARQQELLAQREAERASRQQTLSRTVAAARARRCLTGAPSARAFTELEYQTRQSWSRSRRVEGKIDASWYTHMGGIVYCGRGEMENVLKQQTLDLSADRLSTQHLGSNQLRLWLATLAYLLLERLRRVGLRGSELAQATVGTIRTRLLKVAASVTVSVRRVWVRLSSEYPLQALYRRCAMRLGCAAAGRSR